MKTTSTETYVSPISEIIEIKEDYILTASPSAYGDAANDGGDWE